MSDEKKNWVDDLLATSRNCQRVIAASTLDATIEALLKHREDVWGKR